jgi:hypothetical protein
MGIAVVIVFVSGGSAIFLLFVAFILMGMVRYVIDFGRRLGRQQTALEEEESVPHSSVDS